MIRLPIFVFTFGLFLALVKNVETSDLDTKTVQKITLKTPSKNGAGTRDHINGEVCGIDGQCCKFRMPYGIGIMGERTLPGRGDSLGQCRKFSIKRRVVRIILYLTRSAYTSHESSADTLVPEYVEVATKSKEGETEIVKCPTKTPVRNSKVTFDCTPTKLSSKSKSIEKVTVKTHNHKYASSKDPLVGKICGLNGNCCTFNVPENSFKKDGTNDFESEKLGDCQLFPINSNVKSIQIEKTGDDTWIGDFIEVTSRQGTNNFETFNCPINYWLRDNEHRTFYCIPKKVLSKAKKIKKITIKTSNVKYAQTANAFKGEACGNDGQCCVFSIPEKGLNKQNGKLDLTSDSLGGCKNFPVYPNVKSIMLKKIGDDTWVGDFIEVFTSDHQYCNINTALRNNGQGIFSCTTCYKKGEFHISLKV